MGRDRINQELCRRCDISPRAHERTIPRRDQPKRELVRQVDVILPHRTLRPYASPGCSQSPLNGSRGMYYADHVASLKVWRYLCGVR